MHADLAFLHLLCRVTLFALLCLACKACNDPPPFGSFFSFFSCIPHGCLGQHAACFHLPWILVTASSCSQPWHSELQLEVKNIRSAVPSLSEGYSQVAALVAINGTPYIARILEVGKAALTGVGGACVTSLSGLRDALSGVA